VRGRGDTGFLVAVVLDEREEVATTSLEGAIMSEGINSETDGTIFGSGCSPRDTRSSFVVSSSFVAWRSQNIAKYFRLCVPTITLPEM
jgi:hypothetical protein